MKKHQEKFLNLLVILFVWINTTAFAEISTSWPVIVQSGKGNEHFNINKTLPLNKLIKSIYPLNNYEVKNSIIDKKRKTKVIYIGQISGIRVYDLIYPLDKNSDDRLYEYLKVTVLEKEPNRYIPAFFNFLDQGKYQYSSLDTIKHSFIVADKNLIANELPITGSGGSIDSTYLYIPPEILKNKKITPKFVNLDIIYETLKQKLPKNHNAVNGQGFDINTLHFHSCVTTGAHCFDGDSSVDMQFKLENGELKLISFEYHKSKK